MLILASLGRSLLSTMEELLVFSTNCESNPRDLLMPCMTDLDPIEVSLCPSFTSSSAPPLLSLLQRFPHLLLVGMRPEKTAYYAVLC